LKRLFLIDIPFKLQNQILNNELNGKTAYPLLFENNQRINSESFDQRLKSFQSKSLFWQVCLFSFSFLNQNFKN
jgi:hypothetical protein